MRIELDKRFKKNVQGLFGRYALEVGVLDDGPHKIPKTGERGKKGQDVLSEYAGGPVRQKTRKNGLSISQVSAEYRAHLGFNYLAKPFKDRTSDVIKLSKRFFELAFGRSEKRRVETLLQAVVRNPILRGDYGPNSALTIAIKGFDRHGIDTAQLFKSLKARVTVRSSRV